MTAVCHPAIMQGWAGSWVQGSRGSAPCCGPRCPCVFCLACLGMSKGTEAVPQPPRVVVVFFIGTVNFCLLCVSHPTRGRESPVRCMWPVRSLPVRAQSACSAQAKILEPQTVTMWLERAAVSCATSCGTRTDVRLFYRNQANADVGLGNGQRQASSRPGRRDSLFLRENEKGQNARRQLFLGRVALGRREPGRRRLVADRNGHASMFVFFLFSTPRCQSVGVVRMACAVKGDQNENLRQALGCGLRRG